MNAESYLILNHVCEHLALDHEDMVALVQDLDDINLFGQADRLRDIICKLEDLQVTLRDLNRKRKRTSA